MYGTMFGSTPANVHKWTQIKQPSYHISFTISIEGTRYSASKAFSSRDNDNNLRRKHKCLVLFGNRKIFMFLGRSILIFTSVLLNICANNNTRTRAWEVNTYWINIYYTSCRRFCFVIKWRSYIVYHFLTQFARKIPLPIVCFRVTTVVTYIGYCPID